MSVSAPFDPVSTLAHLTRGERARALLHTQTIASRPAIEADFPSWVDPTVYAAVRGSGVSTLWSHQREMADLLHAGRHTALATGTASGKSLGFMLPVLTSLAQGLAAPTGRGSTAIYLAPTKALGADQHARLHELAVPGVRVAVYDGDTPSEERRWVRDHAHYVLTNPDLLHYSLLPGHEYWSRFLRKLSYVVVDECHTYRGVFGAHVSAVLRRLLRIAARYGAHPTVALASATTADPAMHAEALIGAPVADITRDGSPRAAVTVALWQPQITSDGTRRSAVAESADICIDLMTRQVQTVVFARSRVAVEVIAARARAALRVIAPDLVDSVAAYRGGYLPEERRALESSLRAREVLGLAATNALELGIDIAGLDVVVLAGWPGRLSSLWQQAGRAGRSGQPSLAVLVAADDPLDTYLVNHPERIFGGAIESSVFDPANPQVLGPHLAAAAAELPLTEADVVWFGPTVGVVAAKLARQQILRRRPTGWFYARADRAADQLSLRSVGGTVRIVELRTGRVLGTVDQARAHSAVHTGAVYVHQGTTYVVTELDLDLGAAVVVAGDPGWSTHAASVSDFRLLTAQPAQQVRCGSTAIAFGEVEVASQVTSFLRRSPSGEVLGRHTLDLPVRSMHTQAVWWSVHQAELAAVGLDQARVPGALHAAEHALIGLLPLLATCDRWDIGGVSTAHHPDTELPTVMIYDGYPGGAGFARHGFERVRHWLGATARTIEDCGCPAGCPGCVQSPKCGNGNDPLDKHGAVAVLHHLLRPLS